uniref:Uncharacterized protein n=1 Tax=Oncorhynchus mykiss TaxID=8022 RepID=A0A8C7T8S4_ONCMY
VSELLADLFSALHSLTPSSGCFAYWCFPCFAYTTSKFGECFCLPLLDILMGFTQLVWVSSRTPRVHGDMMADCVYSTFCNICSWCQLAREIKRRRQTITVINAHSRLFSFCCVLPPSLSVPSSLILHFSPIYN